MRNLSETHGIDLIRRVADEKIRDPKLKSRVWSDEMRSWGFFNEKPNELDVMLIIGCARSGDMFRLENYGSQLFTVTTCEVVEFEKKENTFIVLDLVQFELDGTSLYGLRLLSSHPPMLCQLLTRQSSVFKIAWEYL